MCGRLGHRADVCPAPENTICRGCGILSPTEDHQCTPKCSLYNGPHLTVDKTCNQRYQIPYIIRQRRKECRIQAQDFLALTASPPAPPGTSSRGRSRDRVPHRHRPASISRSRSRTPAVHIQDHPTPMATSWASRVENSIHQVMGSTPPEYVRHPRLNPTNTQSCYESSNSNAKKQLNSTRPE